MAAKATTFGIAMRNFTRYPELPDAGRLIDYGMRMEQLGFESLWVWDHVLLGTDPHFPIIDSLSLLTAVAARTTKIKLGTGVLVLPLRNPLALAKQLSSIDLISNGRLILGMASGWYKREFDALGVPFNRRGKIMDENIEIMTRLWREDSVTAEIPPYNMRQAVMFPKPAQRPRPTILIGGYVDAVLKRAGVAGDGWLTYFYTPEGFTRSWTKVRGFAAEAGKDPDALLNGNQLPIMVGKSRAAVEERMNEWLRTEWDFASWSESTPQSAVMGTVDECVAQLKEHINVGVQRLIFVPYRYEAEQIEIIAKEIVPRLQR
ncbi:MAG: TIGR03619 family F420-dependent LLM class oxidoreductase [Proteobacteria bacterium]|nr:TIGR03619 family F420-dependent LLM class oxidoreductase [Pseudomonadota bacterium]